jgi:hypothetical protein
MTPAAPPLHPPLKHDAGKARWDLLPLGPVAAVVAVLSFGAKKYAPNGWVAVAEGPDGADRYYAAVLRHLVAWRRGEATDPESGLPHLAHAACGVLFLLWLGGER